MLRDSFFQVRAMPKQNHSHRRIIWSYILDYVCILLGGALAAGIRFIPNTHTQFSLLEPTINFTYHSHETIPVWLSFVLSAVIPAIFMLLICTFAIGEVHSSKTWKGRAKDFYQVFLGLNYAILFSFMVSSALERFSGQPRPDFIDRCEVDPRVYEDEMIMVWRAGMADISVCMQTDNFILSEGFASFLSGHCAVGFAGLGYLSIFLALRLSVLKPHPELVLSTSRDSIPLFRVLLASLPLAIATGIAITRVLDNRHHPFDVIAGSLVGIGCAWIAYRTVLLPHSRPRKHSEFMDNGHLRSTSQDLESYPLAGMARK